MNSKQTELKPYDILQILSKDGDTWNDFSTLRTPTDFESAKAFVDGRPPSDWKGRKFRVVRTPWEIVLENSKTHQQLIDEAGLDPTDAPSQDDEINCPLCAGKNPECAVCKGTGVIANSLGDMGEHGDDWKCLCGNSTDDSGAYPCDYKGEDVEPTTDEWPLDLYRCDRCGLIFNNAGEIQGAAESRKFKEVN